MKLLPLLCLLSPWFGPGSAQGDSVVTVEEDEDALLPCSLGPEQKIKKFDWKKDAKEVFLYDNGPRYKTDSSYQDAQFRGRVEFFEDELKAGNASIKITSTRLEDNGNYTCVLFHPKRQEINIRLNVDGVLKIRNHSGAAPMPNFEQDLVGNTRRSVACKAQGFPKPEVEWKNSAGKGFSAEDLHKEERQDAKGRFHVTLTVIVARSDNYTCVVTQKDIYHQITRTKEVHIQVAETPTELIALAVALAIAVLLLILGLLFYCKSKTNKNNNPGAATQKRYEKASAT